MALEKIRFSPTALAPHLATHPGPLRDSILIFFRCVSVMLNFQRKIKELCGYSFINMILLVLYFVKMLTFLVCQQHLLNISLEIGRKEEFLEIKFYITISL